MWMDYAMSQLMTANSMILVISIVLIEDNDWDPVNRVAVPEITIAEVTVVNRNSQ
jgi:hypothetical protein